MPPSSQSGGAAAPPAPPVPPPMSLSLPESSGGAMVISDSDVISVGKDALSFSIKIETLHQLVSLTWCVWTVSKTTPPLLGNNEKSSSLLLTSHDIEMKTHLRS